MTVTISAPNANGDRTFTFSKIVPSAKLLDMAERRAGICLQSAMAIMAQSKHPRPLTT